MCGCGVEDLLLIRVKREQRGRREDQVASSGAAHGGRDLLAQEKRIKIMEEGVEGLGWIPVVAWSRGQGAVHGCLSKRERRSEMVEVGEGADRWGPPVGGSAGQARAAVRLRVEREWARPLWSPCEEEWALAQVERRDVR